MAEKREKTVSYRRAEWLDPNWPDLETHLRNALKKLKTVSERSLVQGDQFAKVAQTADGSGGGLLLHVTTETPGEAASVVPKVAANSVGLELKSQKPPPDGEWLDGDAFLYVNSDHVCLCATAVHDTAIKTFIWDFFKKAKLGENSIKFELMKVADIAKVKMLKAQGVKELEIRGTLFAATASYENRKAHAQSMLGAAARQIKAILKKPNDVTPDGLRVCLTLKTDERHVNDLALGEKRIETLAADTVNNFQKGDDYVIVTKSGQRISPTEIFVRTKVSVLKDGKTVKRSAIWKELVKFHNELVAAGILET
ncbi:MAG TPA: hypothetical protein VHY79_02605 [Rhizomicrobium sp.]|jgi:hypothetical protein|nr:hypothetical protein [Rhizomicrobium sp.]